MITETLLGSNLWSVEQVDISDPRIGATTDYGIGFTLDEMNLLIFGVKSWDINISHTTGTDLFNWWGGSLPTGFLPNMNVWNGFGLVSFLYRWGNDSNATTAPCFSVQEDYVNAIMPVDYDFLKYGLCTCGLVGQFVSNDPTMGFDVSLVYCDGDLNDPATLFYPRCFCKSGGSPNFLYSTNTNDAGIGGVTAVPMKNLVILGKSTPVYKPLASLLVTMGSDLVWDINERW